MGRISDHRGFMGTRGIFLERWRYSQPVQTTSPVMNSSTLETASVLSLTGDLEELDWYFQDMFDQFGNVYCLFDDINCLLINCPLKFLLLETQQLVSFLRRHYKCPPFKPMNSDLLPLFPSPINPNLSPLLYGRIDRSPTFGTSYEDSTLP